MTETAKLVRCYGLMVDEGILTVRDAVDAMRGRHTVKTPPIPRPDHGAKASR